MLTGYEIRNSMVRAFGQFPIIDDPLPDESILERLSKPFSIVLTFAIGRRGA